MKFVAQQKWPLTLVGLLALAGLTAALNGNRLAGDTAPTPVPTPTSVPLNLTIDETNEVHKLHNKAGQLLLFNFRTVEPGVLYRGSGFPANVKYEKDGKPDRKPAAYADAQMFDFLRAKNIRLIVALQRKESFYRERGHFEWWANKTGYKIEVVNLEVETGAQAYIPGHGGGLRAAEKFIELMKKRDPAKDGAVYVHCDAGKDRTGVAVAAYELWRNRGVADKDALWNQVKARYLLSDKMIATDQEAMNWSGKREACGDGTSGFVCPKWLDNIRTELETVAAG